METTVDQSSVERRSPELKAALSKNSTTREALMSALSIALALLTLTFAFFHFRDAGAPAKSRSLSGVIVEKIFTPGAEPPASEIASKRGSEQPSAATSRLLSSSAKNGKHMASLGATDRGGGGHIQIEERRATMKDELPAEELRPHCSRVAAILSVLPGLGHLYKGYYLAGARLGLVGAALAVWLFTLISLAYAVGAIVAALGFSVHWLALLLNPVTIYLGLLPALLLWMAVAADAYDEPELRLRASEHSTQLPGKGSTRVSQAPDVVEAFLRGARAPAIKVAPPLTSHLTPKLTRILC